MTSPSRAIESRPQLHGLTRVVVALVWLALVAVLLGAFAAGVQVRLGQLLSLDGDQSSAPIFGLPKELQAIYASRLGPAEAEAMSHLGISLRAYAAYLLAFEIGLALG